MREVDLELVLTRRTLRRVRLIQAGALLTLTLVVVVLTLRSYQAAQPRPSPTTVALVSQKVAIYTNVNEGMLIVNGTQVNTPPPTTVTLRPGINAITLIAPIFQTRHCTVDTRIWRVTGAQCLTGGIVSPPVDTGTRPPQAAIYMPMTLADLPSWQVSDVEALVTRHIEAVAFRTTVPAHQYIGTGVDSQGHITSRLTNEDVQAELALAPPPGQTAQNDFKCVENLCIPEYDSIDLPDATANAWIIATQAVSQWRFHARAGETEVTSPLSQTPLNIMNVGLHYDPAAGWQVMEPTSAFSQNTLQILSNLDCDAGVNALFSYVPADAAHNIRTRPNGLQGCEIQVFDSGGKRTAHLIWRFGVLLAADSPTHTLIPGIPVAPQAELDAIAAAP